ncbi:MAG: hypothetical protein ACKOUM_05365, partial [Sphingopyxis sp.]
MWPRHAGTPGNNADGSLFDEVEQRGRKREFAGAHCDTQHAKGNDRSRRVVERGFAHNCLRDA